MPSQPQPGFIHLILLSQQNPFYLEIPTAIVPTLCLRPRKYLRYLGWCVLGVIVVLKDEQGNRIALNGELVDRGVYHYIVPDRNALAHAIDLEVIKQRSHVQSETMGTHEVCLVCAPTCSYLSFPSFPTPFLCFPVRITASILS